MSNKGNRVNLFSRFIIDVKHYKLLYLMIAPYIVFFTLFTILPILAAFFLSFTNYDMFSTPSFIGIKNYLELFVNDTIFYTALKNTFVFAVITGPLSYFLCFIIAWFINEFPRWLRMFLTLLFYAPSLSSSVYFIWTFIFSGDTYGIMNGFLMQIGIINEPIQWFTDTQYMLPVLMIVQVWMSLGTSFLAFIAGFQGIDRSLYEAADVDGIKNRWQELIYITFPLLKPQLIFSAIMQITTAFSVSTISQQLCGMPSTKYAAHTLVLHIIDYGTIRYEMGYACAISVVLFVIVLMVKKLIDLALSYVPDA
jgi:sugar ABC transporter, permease protein